MRAWRFVPTLHIIIGGNNRYVSLKERGMGFEGKLNEPHGVYQVRETEVIYTYTRSQALADGVLVDVSPMAAQAGFRHPTVVTADLHAALETNMRERSYGQSYEGRLWDVLFMASLAARRANWDSQTAFSVSLEVCQGNRGRMRRSSLHLWLHIGPGDAGEPVITIGFPEDF